MKRSLQEYVELAIFGLLAAFIGTALVYLAGWGVTWVGWLLRKLAVLLWFILKFILPVAIVVVAAYVIWRVVQNRRNNTPQGTPAAVVGGAAGTTSTTTTEAQSVAAEAVEEASEATEQQNGAEGK